MNSILDILKLCYLSELFSHLKKNPKTVPTDGIFTFQWVFNNHYMM